MVTEIKQHSIGVGDYYQYISEPGETANDWNPGDLVLILKLADDGVTFQHFNGSSRMPVDDFHDSFEYDPEGEAKSVTTQWRRTRRGLEILQPLGWPTKDTPGFNHATDREWFDFDFPGFLAVKEQMLWFDPGVFSELRNCTVARYNKRSQARDRESLMENLTEPIRDLIAAEIWAQRKAAFLNEGGMEGQWAAYKAKQYALEPAVRDYPHRTRRAVLALLNSNIPVIGKTVTQVWKEARKFGIGKKRDDSDASYYRNIRSYTFIAPLDEPERTEI